ncbi:hypothetical protein BKA62DRAFT_674731 [Auriculariales sp. MPI-PUGE-AT-0066]|nr:hypothetical protein BKA62DRAFT_674731 [Auriculariales sp. MPI-PUGE-AT-0066]
MTEKEWPGVVNASSDVAPDASTVALHGLLCQEAVHTERLTVGRTLAKVREMIEPPYESITSVMMLNQSLCAPTSTNTQPSESGQGLSQWALSKGVYSDMATASGGAQCRELILPHYPHQLQRFESVQIDSMVWVWSIMRPTPIVRTLMRDIWSKRLNLEVRVAVVMMHSVNGQEEEWHLARLDENLWNEYGAPAKDTFGTTNWPHSTTVEE